MNDGSPPNNKFTFRGYSINDADFTGSTVNGPYSKTTKFPKGTRVYGRQCIDDKGKYEYAFWTWAKHDKNVPENRYTKHKNQLYYTYPIRTEEVEKGKFRILGEEFPLFWHPDPNERVTRMIRMHNEYWGDSRAAILKDIPEKYGNLLKQTPEAAQSSPPSSSLSPSTPFSSSSAIPTESSPQNLSTQTASAISVPSSPSPSSPPRNR
jgi:hypothetical protein